MNPNSRLTLITVTADSLKNKTREEIISLCTRAYEEDFRPFMDTFDGATHIIGYADGHLVTHGLWVTRYLQVGEAAPLRTAYVEAVATDQAYRRRGYAQALMERIAIEIQDYELAGLSPFNVPYYSRLGWEVWHGPLFIRTEHRLEQSSDDEEVMIHRLPKTPDINLYLPLSAEWREGELW